MNEGLFTAYQKLPEWQELNEKASVPGCIALADIAEGERPFLAAALASSTGRPVMMICANDLTAQRNAQDIERLTGIPATVLPSRDVQFSRAAMSRESTWQRLSVLDKLVSAKVRVLCCSIDALLDRCAPKERFFNAIIELQEGLRFRPDKLMEQLLKNGYERVSLVEGKGQCALRGSILDVFPSNAQDSIRIEFFDDEIDSMRRFDSISQCSIGRIKTVRIAPATECLIADPQKAAQALSSALKEHESILSQKNRDIPTAENEVSEVDGLQPLNTFLTELDALEQAEDLLKSEEESKTGKPKPVSEQEMNRQRHEEDVERIRAGQSIRTATMWMNVLCEGSTSVIDYLDRPILLCDRADQFLSRAKASADSFSESYEDAAQRGDAFPAQKKLRMQYEDFVIRTKQETCIALTEFVGTFGLLEPKAVLSFGSQPSTPYQSRMDSLMQDIRAWREEGLSIVLLTGGEARGKRLQRTLEEADLPAVYSETLDGNLIIRETILLPVAYTKGFIHKSAKLAVISDTDIYGTAYQRARKKQNAGERIASFTDLSVGDYVVHDLHGVGLYKGIVQMKDGQTTRDYLLIQYAGNDKLYVPTDQFDRVTKFIGAEQQLPKLNTLGGNEWQRQTAKVKAHLKELAFDLAALYAKRSKETGYAFSKENPWKSEFEDMFPYELTEDQQKSVAEIEADMESPHNMDRLLCGDVGFGKTEVALRAAFKAVVEGKQVAILAPTTILVQQHYNTIRKRFAGFGVHFDMLSRFRSAKEQKEILQKLANGELDLIVGTHQLLGKRVKFKDLGLLIVDEEQRFGVNHKETIQHMKSQVDVLTLSATPIPRTLHMSMVGIRDMSLLETPPEERLPIKTYVTEYNDAIIREAIRREISRGGQVYFLYNRVRSIAQMHDRLKALVPEARIGIAHGQMKENALEDVMLDFYAGAFDVLLCTTIVESGLDVPDANTLIVFDSDRFGLSQLYQIRGRVGRSSRQAYAYFTVRAGKVLSETAEQRLSAIREFTEFGAGYRIAMRDLEIRGAGDVLGPDQSGHMSTIGYDMYCKLIEQAIDEAKGIEQLPELDTRVDLSIDAYLPEDYVPQEKLRIEVYKRIAMVESDVTRSDIEDELVDRFGDIPQPVLNLMDIAQLRSVTRKLGISRFSVLPDGIHMRMEEKYMPDAALLFESMSKTDARLRFLVGKTPEMVLAQRNLTPLHALAEGINVTKKLKNILDQIRQAETEKA